MKEELMLYRYEVKPGTIWVTRNQKRQFGWYLTDVTDARRLFKRLKHTLMWIDFQFVEQGNGGWHWQPDTGWTKVENFSDDDDVNFDKEIMF